MTRVRAMARLPFMLAMAVAPLATNAQVIATACNAGGPRAGSAAEALHPDRVLERFASPIANREWMPVLRSVQQDVRRTFADLTGTAPTPAFTALRATFESALAAVLDSLPAILDVDLSRRAARLQGSAFRQFEPFPDMNGDWRILQVDPPRPIGEIVDPSLKPDEAEAICWAGRSVSHLLGGVNFETVPGALARITALARAWEGYRFNGPSQLLHELVASSTLHALFPATGRRNFEPPRVDLVLIHPFAGVELARRDSTIRESESLAIELGGVTAWFGQWTHYVGVSWVIAYDGSGSIGRGPLLHASRFATAGVLFRKDDVGVRRKSLLLTVDLLKFLRSDETRLATQQLRAIAGRLTASPLRP